MNILIRKATAQDIDHIVESYEELFLHERKYGAYTIWQPGIYPTRETAEKALAEDALYAAEQNGEICASIIANQTQPEEYGSISWKYCASHEQTLVIHLLCVRPSKAGRGLGKDMVRFAVERARQMNCTTVRLDTGLQNKPAIALYTKLGFELAGTLAMAVGGKILHNDHLFYELKI